MSKSINQWVRDVYTLAADKGWHPPEPDARIGDTVAKYLMNLHAEVSEAWEAYRAGKLFDPCDKAEKMKALGLRPLSCLEEEFADIVIRVMDDAAALGIDLESAIEVKHAYNATRAHRHGGKLA